MNATSVAGALLDGRYRVGPVLAHGGMSTVHRGHDTRLDRPVAIKIMDERLARDPVFRMRFEREARSAARIDHPAVVDVHDQGADGGRLFLVMELVEGGTLRDVMAARGAPGVPVALAVLDQVLSGLAQAHRLGLVHRDVKPENVLISMTGEVKVADFGLAVAAAQAGASHAGMIMGTVAYLSPEQVETGAADPRSDVYSAGILLYELLTGSPPYTGDTAISVAYRHVTADVPPPSRVATEVPPELDALVLRATRRDPSARPADAAALLSELRAVARALEVPRVAVPAPAPRRVEDEATVPRVDRARGYVDARPAEPAGLRAAGPAAPGSSGAPGSGAAASGAGDSRAGGRGARQPGTGGPGASAFDGRVDGGATVRSGRGGTRALPRPSGDAGLAPHVRARRRARRVVAIWITIVLALALTVGLSAWWFGSGRWTAVPSLTGVRQDVAEQLLAQDDLTTKETTAYDDGAPSGVVTRTDPGPDARLLRGSTVTVVVSRGRPTVPAVAPGTAVADAATTVRAAQLAPVSGGTTEYSATVPQGAVVRTDPAAGAALPLGGSITLVVSGGPQPPSRVRVPLVIGRHFDEAAATLEVAGLVAQEHRAFGGFGRADGLVTDQSNGAGSMVDPGTTITLDTF